MYRLKFYIPFMYAYETRMEHRCIGLMNWFSQYIIPILLFIYLHGGHVTSTIFLLFLLVYTIYEIGYIQNDTETTKKEKSPTMRLNEIESAYYERHRWIIYTERILLGLALSSVLILYHKETTSVCLSWSLLPLYLIYNVIRGCYTFVLHFLLMYIRYIGLILPFISHFTWMDYLFLSLMYPLPSIIVRLSRGKIIAIPKAITLILKGYRYRYNFVVKYYATLLLLCGALGMIEICTYTHLILSLYYLVRAILFKLLIARDE
jgi:hypothetical protein